ncbi:MAG: hypothetical protein RIQ99_1027 [Pseudomonadota bacterium]
MNNNRGNNRRRGRGNRQNGGGGGQQLNRIDSRARGNAPQLLEKYRKLAQDAHLNGDRVQAEYYLQFADHYFRVLADTRLRQEEQRARRDDRWQEGGEESDDAADFSVDNDFPNFDQPTFTRPQRDDRPRREDRDEDGAAPTDATDDATGDDTAQGNPYEPSDNPFVRDNRGRPGLRPRRDSREGRDSRDSRDERRPRRDRAATGDDGESTPAGLDPASLPPAISAGRDEPSSDEDAKPRRAPRARRKPAPGDAGEAAESLN